MKISHTSCTMYQECPYKWFLHYIRKLRPVDEKSSFAFGSAIDAGLNTLLETKDANVAVLTFTTAWMKHSKSNLVYTKADLETHLLADFELEYDVQQQSWCSLREKGKIFIHEFNVQVMPQIKNVIKVQIEEELPNGSGDELIIKADHISELQDGRRILFDNKTSSVKYDADSVSKSAQLATYFDALREEYKLDACGYIVIPKKTRVKKLPPVDIEIITGTVDEKMIENTFKTYEKALDGIKNNEFEKNEESCISKYGKCQYYGFCKYNSSKGLAEKK